MRVSVIMPTYNRAGQLLQESLVSILEQTRPPDEIIVVDDGSTDHTGDQVQHLFDEWQWEWPRARYIRQKKNKGKSVAANIGLFESTGDLLWVWDDDDIAALDRIEKLVPMFEADKALGLVHTWAQWAEPDGQLIEWRPAHTHISQVLRAQLRGNMFFTISVMFRRTLLDVLSEVECIYSSMPTSGAITWQRAHGLLHFDPQAMAPHQMAKWPFDPRLIRAQDYDLWIRLAHTMVLHGMTCQLLPSVTVEARNHRGHRGPGHKLKFDDIPKETLKHEKRIFKRFMSNVPISEIFPGYKRGNQIAAVAHTERAVALMMRGLFKLAEKELNELRPVIGLLETREHMAMLRQLSQQQAETGGPLAGLLSSIVSCIPSVGATPNTDSMLIY